MRRAEEHLRARAGVAHAGLDHLGVVGQHRRGPAAVGEPPTLVLWLAWAVRPAGGLHDAVQREVLHHHESPHTASLGATRTDMAYPAVSIVAVTETPSPLALPTPADAEEWLDGRARGDLDRARELVGSDQGGPPDRRRRPAEPVERRQHRHRQRGLGGVAVQRGPPRGGGALARRGGDAGGPEARHRPEPGPRPLRGVRRRRRVRSRPHGEAAAGQDAARLPPRRRRQGRRHPRPGQGAVGAGHPRRAGVQQEHPRRRPHRSRSRPNSSRACRRTGSTPTSSTRTASSR